MNNNEISEYFSLLSKLMDLHGENSFKSKSYANTAFVVERLPNEIEGMDDAELFNIRGIGESTGKKIRELTITGKLPQLEQLISNTPPGILDIMQIKGLGPKKTAVIWNELGIESVGELEYACNENRLVSLKGFGAKTQEAVLKSIEFMRSNIGYHLWAEAHNIAEPLLNSLLKSFAANRFMFTGAYRRQYEVVESIEIITDLDKTTLLKQFDGISDIKISGENENTVTIQLPNQPKIIFYFSNPVDFYTNLFRTTGNDEFVRAFFTKYQLPNNPQSEEELFSSNQLPFIPPALRESAAVLEKLDKVRNGLIQPGQIKGIIHSHSKWSDGNNTIEEMAKSAIDKGFEYLVLSDHSQSAFYANGLNSQRIAAQHGEIDALNAKLAPFKIFKSIESDILNDGSLDYNTDVLATFDLVIASVHSNLKMTEEKAMHRVMTAIQNPYTTILGHPTGRLLLSRPGYPLDFKAIIDACAQNNVVIEINAHPRRLDIDWRWIEYAMEKGVLLSIDPDAHSVDGYNDVFFGIMAAQKGGLTSAQNLSSFTLQQFEEFLNRSRSKRMV